MRAIIIDSQPLVRIGILRMLEHLPDIGPVLSIDPEAVGTLAVADERVLVVYGMSSESTDNWALLRRLHRRMPQARILLLSDNIWLHVPSSLQVCRVMAHAPKSASIERLEASIRHLLGDTGAMPQPAPRSEAWQPLHPPHAIVVPAARRAC
jgi:DNA-binding NarL/FixJ family response regulator